MCILENDSNTHFKIRLIYSIIFLLFFILSYKKSFFLGQSDSISVRTFTEMKMFIVFCVITLYNLVVFVRLSGQMLIPFSVTMNIDALRFC